MLCFHDLHHLTDSDSDAFWRRVNLLIKQQKLTQQAVADSISVHYSTFKGWSHVKCYPSLISIHHIAQVLGVSMNHLIFGAETEKCVELEYAIGKKVLDAVRLVKEALKD